MNLLSRRLKTTSPIETHWRGAAFIVPFTALITLFG